MAGASWIAAFVLAPALATQDRSEPANGAKGPGVVSGIKVLSDKVPDVSSMEAWKQSFIKEGMTDEQKALAIWKTVWTFQYQASPPHEFLQYYGDLHDPVKIFNVYGYSYCSVASSEVVALARYVGLKARDRGINCHNVAEVYWDGAWHMLDASLICYFPKPDGKIASVDEIIAGIKEWTDKNPGIKGNDARQREFMRAGGWRQGPEVLRRCPTYDDNGWLPAATHGWYSTMQEYDGSHNGILENGYSQGYRVHIQLRPGERLTRNWSHRGLTVSGPHDLLAYAVAKHMPHSVRAGDLAPGRIGNGTHEYVVPVRTAAYRAAALSAENLQDGRVAVRDPAKPGVLVLRMPSSFVYLTGKLSFAATGETAVSFSDNNGLDWKEIARGSSTQDVDLTALVLRRYDYRLRFELKGKDAALQALSIRHDIQNSQRALPALDAGKNTIRFSAGPDEGTVTVEGSTVPDFKGKNLHYTDFRPKVHNITEPNIMIADGGAGHVAFPVSTPGDLVRLRFGSIYRARDARDGFDYEVSFDGGKTWKTVDRAPGETGHGSGKYVTFSEVPRATRDAWVRFSGTNRSATLIMNFRIDADYREPHGGFRPVKVTYRWDEDGKAKEHTHVAKKPQETYTITCDSKPLLKSIALELADP